MEYSIGDFSKLTGLGIHTLRYKESNRILGWGGYFFVLFMYAIKIDTMIPRIIRTTVSNS